MKVKALVSFCGKVSMGKGEVREVTYQDILKDLLKAGYVVEVKEETPKPALKKAVKANEAKKAHDS